MGKKNFVPTRKSRLSIKEEHRKGRGCNAALTYCFGWCVECIANSVLADILVNSILTNVCRTHVANSVLANLIVNSKVTIAHRIACHQFRTGKCWQLYIEQCRRLSIGKSYCQLHVDNCSSSRTSPTPYWHFCAPTP